MDLNHHICRHPSRFWVQLFRRLSSTFNHLHLITLSSAQLRREVLIEMALWSGITGKSQGGKRAVIKREHWYVGSLSSPTRSTQRESTLTCFSLGQVYVNYFSAGCVHFGYLVLSSMRSLCFHAQGQCLRISEKLISSFKIPAAQKELGLFTQVKAWIHTKYSVCRNDPAFAFLKVWKSYHAFILRYTYSALASCLLACYM